MNRSQRTRRIIRVIPLIGSLLAVVNLSGAGGTLDTVFSANLGTGFSGNLNALAVQSDGRILAAGTVNSVNGVLTRNVARLNPDGSVDGAFSENLADLFPTNSSVNGQGLSVAVQPDGRILLGGIFDADNLPHSFLARINADGTPDVAFRATLDASGALNQWVGAIGIQSDGKIVVGNGSNPRYIVRLNPDGSEDTAFKVKIGTGFSGSVRALAIQRDGKIVAAGAFSMFNGEVSGGLARLNPDGSFDTAFANRIGNGTFGGSSGGTGVTSMALQPDGKILVGGNFTTAGFVSPSKCVARFGTDGAVDAAFGANLGTGCDGMVLAIAAQPGGIVVGGDFTTMNGVASSKLARLNPDGSVDTIFAANLAGTGFTQTGFGPATPAVSALAYQVNGKLLAGGFFTAVNNVASRMAARFGAAPALLADRTSLNFGAAKSFTSLTPAQIVRLTQSGDGTVTWTAKSNQPWLTVSPTSGSGSAALNIAVKFHASLPASGTFSGDITLTLNGAANTINPITVTLAVTPPTGAVSVPFGSFDTPAGGNTALAGSIAVTGWTLDNVGVKRLELWRDLQSGETTPPFASTMTDPRNGKVFIANATFVDNARLDVEALHPNTPYAYRAGWGYLLLTRGLWNQGNGTYRLYAVAFDQEDNFATIGTKTIVVSNDAAAKPFGSIDTPSIGGAPGTAPNFGWALTPPVGGAATCKIQANGVQVSIDSGPLQPVVYGDARTDIAGAFPGFSNSAAAGGHYIFDWSTLTNGPHTIGWLVTDDCGRVDGVGSRFFDITTGSSLPAGRAFDGSAASLRVAGDAFGAGRRETESDAPVTVSRGYGELPEIVGPGVAGSRTVEVNQGERIEIRLPRGFESAYQLAPNGQRRAVPIGATWDADANIFYWHPAAGFMGRYRLVFTNGNQRISVRVVIVPR